VCVCVCIWGGDRGIAHACWYRYMQGSETWVSRFSRITALSVA